ncbi:uncharacterized protein EI90DRAFT_3114753 [Cantharellus anzutake]|uniref:uncharacterized protein n=1 Tax=Cantharellus anzutake TaxID=1750568 RepID=UPI001907EDC4|nr:uncharacterized protein EI90DRAFT_3114753 [Cantharellus anzutake]KAF8344085.1 hypothetical protein EI90DRAFT_3114753 [Cantharellus anzutake]
MLPQLPPFPTFEEVEDFLIQLERYVPYPSDVAQVVQQIYRDLMRFGPPEFPQMPAFERIVQVPAPPSPPPPKTTVEKFGNWVTENKWILILASLLAAGGAGYCAYNLHNNRNRLAERRRNLRNPASSKKASEPQRDVVIILGVDAVDYGMTIVKYFVDNGFIVIGSTLSTEAADEIEKIGKGYARALVLDAEEPGSIPHFLRSLSSTLSLRFPTTAHGDPYASTTSGGNLPQVVSLISLLSLAPSDHLPFSDFASPILLHETLNHQITLRAMTPLSIIQATFPHFKHRKALGSPSSPQSISKGASIIMCVPAIARVGVLGSSGLAMASEAAVRGFEVLRREAAVDPTLNDVRKLRFITVDVGEIGDATSVIGVKRRPTDVGIMSDTLLGIVNEKRSGWSLEWIRGLWLGNRRRVGAGALTYTMASLLPGFILDFMLTLPYRLEELRLSLQEARQLESVPPLEPDITKLPPQATAAVAEKTVEVAREEIMDEYVPTKAASETDTGSVSSGETRENVSQTGSIAESWVMHDANDDLASPPNEGA